MSLMSRVINDRCAQCVCVPTRICSSISAVHVIEWQLNGRPPCSFIVYNIDHKRFLQINRVICRPVPFRPVGTIVGRIRMLATIDFPVMEKSGPSGEVFVEWNHRKSLRIRRFVRFILRNPALSKASSIWTDRKIFQDWCLMVSKPETSQRWIYSINK